MQCLLSAGAGPDLKNKRGFTPLLAAAHQGHVGVVRALLAAPLHVVAAKAHCQADRALLRSSSSPSAAQSGAVQTLHADLAAVANNPCSAALHVAAGRVHVRVVQQLLEAGVKPDLQNPAGFTAMYIAAAHNHAAVVEVLLAAHANTEAGPHGFTPLHAAAERGHSDVVRLLLASHADVHAAARKTGETPLHYAARGLKGRPLSSETVALLLQHGAKVNQRDYEGNTALMWGAEAGRDAAVSQLLNNKADVSAVNSVGHTAMHMAAVRGHAQVVQQLFNAHARVCG